MAASSILLRGGTIIQHDTEDNISIKSADVLIEGDRIAKIAPSIDSRRSATKIIDCTSKIVSPGFIDTHHHLWQTQLKGRHGDQVLSQYLLPGNFTASLYSPADALWGNLGGGLEALNAGTTCVVDHSHIAYSPQHVRGALDGLVSSGLRAVYCPSIAGRVKQWTPKFELEPEVLPEWLERLIFEKLGGESPWGDHGRVRMGLATDAISMLPKEKVRDLFVKARKAAFPVITLHAVLGYMGADPITPLDELALLGPDVLLSHGSNITPAHAARIATTGAHVASTATTELQMAHGTPACFRRELGGPFARQCALGIDCHSVGAASMASEMRLALQSARARLDRPAVEAGTDPGRVAVPLREVFNLATVGGARAVGLGGHLGALREGLLADVVVWDAASPAMVCAAAHDPVAAIVLHSSVSDVDAVVVGGVVRKEGGRLRPVDLTLSSADYGVKENQAVDWPQVTRKLLDSQAEIQNKVKDLDFEKARKELFGGAS